MSDLDSNLDRAANCRAAISWLVAGVALCSFLPLLITGAIYVVHDGSGTAFQNSMLGMARRYSFVAAGWLSVSFVVSAWYLARIMARPAGVALIAATLAHFLLSVSSYLLGVRYEWIRLTGSLVGLLALIFGLLILRANWRVLDPGK